MEPNEVKTEESAMAVVVHQRKILTTSELIYGKETLSLPKGHREAGETSVDTAIRECFEETNVILTKGDAVQELPSYSYEFITPSEEQIQKTVVPILFKVNGEGVPLPKEKRILSVQWMDIEEFLQKCTHESVKEVVKQIKL